MTLHARGEHFLHGEATGRDAQTALAASIDKIERQVQKLKSKWTERKRQGVSPAKAASATPRPAARRGRLRHRPRAARQRRRQLRIIRARRYAVKPMSVDEAAHGSRATAATRSSCSATRRPSENQRPVPPRRRQLGWMSSLCYLNLRAGNRRRSRRTSKSGWPRVDHRRGPAQEPGRGDRPSARAARRRRRPRAHHFKPAHPEDRPRPGRFRRLPPAGAHPRLRRKRSPLSRKPRRRRTA